MTKTRRRAAGPACTRCCAPPIARRDRALERCSRWPAWGGAKRASEQPLIPLALFAKTVVDAAGGVYLTAEHLTEYRKVCSWCTVSAVALIASVPAAYPEARDALRHLRSCTERSCR